MIDFIGVWWAVVFFECDDFVWTNDLWFLIYIWMWKIYREFWNDRLHWGLNEQLWFFLNVMILSQPMIYDPHFHLNMKNTSWNVKWWTSLKFDEQLFFFECDDFVWTNDLWFLIYIWMWKIYREFWNDRLHWGLDEQLWFFINVMILSRPMIYDSPFSSECEKFIVSLEW